MCKCRILLTCTCFIFAYIALFAMLPEVAWARGQPARTVTLIAGPYVIDVNLYQDPPETDQSVEVTIVPHEDSLRLTGRVLMVPGLGTDAIELHSNLSPLGQTGTLVGTVRMPVRGAWQIVIHLSGPKGEGEASFPVTVAAPGAIPIWLGWLIALTPLLGITWMVWFQIRYRKKLLLRVE
jgi:hypothetical protein